jgi:hypothetical protein
MLNQSQILSTFNRIAPNRPHVPVLEFRVEHIRSYKKTVLPPKQDMHQGSVGITAMITTKHSTLAAMFAKFFFIYNPCPKQKPER